MKNKVVVIHPAIAPYRIDFFNSMNESFDVSFYFEFDNVLEQTFDQKKLNDKLTFQPHFLKSGFMGVKNLRLDILNILRKEKPAVVICSEFNILGFVILFYKFFFNKKVHIYSICDDSFNKARDYKIIARLTRFVLLRFYIGLILCDKRALNWYNDHFSKRLKLIYFPIIQKNNLFRKELKLSLPVSSRLEMKFSLKGKTVLLFVGRLVALKNLLFLLSAFKAIREEQKDVVLILVGDGDQKNDLISKISEYDLQQSVLLVGKFEGLELLAWYNIGDIFILPSYLEAFGAVVNEALLGGCYVFCSSAAGASCLIEEPVNGQIFDPYREDELIGKLGDYIRSMPPVSNKNSLRPDKMPYDFDQLFDSTVAKIQ
jgi:glycosyltransferase involved in cell wall biosynthesis